MSIFKRPATHYGKSPEPQTPYQKAAQAWDERIGSARVQAKNWRYMAFGNLFVSTAFAAALVWQSAQGTVVPWVVEVDRNHEVRVSGPAIANYTLSDEQIGKQLENFIIWVRSLSSDPVIVSQFWHWAYDYTTDGGAAALNDYARSNDPFTRIGRQQVAVEVNSRLRASPNSFRIAWTERHYENGQLARTERWTAILTIVIQTPRSREAIAANPFGIYINAINWSREMSQ